MHCVQVIQLALVLCNLCTRDADLCSYALDSLFRNGLFPVKLPVAKQAEWWAATWHLAGGLAVGAVGVLGCMWQAWARDFSADG